MCRRCRLANNFVFRVQVGSFATRASYEDFELPFSRANSMGAYMGAYSLPGTAPSSPGHSLHSSWAIERPRPMPMYERPRPMQRVQRE